MIYERPQPLTGSETYEELLCRPEWEMYRQAVFNIFGKKCQSCGSTSRIQVHHKKYHYDLLPWEYKNPEDIEILCMSCHEKEHGMTPTYTAIDFKNASKMAVNIMENIK